MTNNIQLRGNCAICGREHAVVKGTMSKHGYRVKNHWFQGICYGEQFAPMQKDRTATEQMTATVRRDCAELRALAAKLRDGKVKPKFVVKNVRVNGKFEDKFIPFDEAPAYDQAKQLELEIWNTENRADAGERFAVDMLKLLDRVYGTPLREVNLDANKPATIHLGETRIGTNGRRLSVTSIDGARVYWKDEKGFKGWTGSTSWRRFEIAV